VRRRGIELLGPGPGICLDLGCGTGLALGLLQEHGWTAVGLDVSSDQLALARERAREARLVHGDGRRLPFADGELDAVVSFFTHTDFDDLAEAFAEAARVLRRGGTFVYGGAHPCFGGPMVARAAALEVPDAVALVRPGYAEAGWRTLPPDPEDMRVRSRVGINHVPLALLFNSIAGSGLAIEAVDEPGGDDPPLFIVVRARKVSAT
jgi:SAM-dependent methyltransferase